MYFKLKYQVAMPLENAGIQKDQSFQVSQLSPRPTSRAIKAHLRRISAIREEFIESFYGDYLSINQTVMIDNWIITRLT